MQQTFTKWKITISRYTSQELADNPNSNNPTKEDCITLVLSERDWNWFQHLVDSDHFVSAIKI
jgi:hypothetical protein